MRAGLDVTKSQGQGLLGPLQSLALALFVATKDKRFVGRI
jgi:hypothetical protein